MSWENRTRPDITFVSPLQKNFTAFWRSNPREMENSLGIKKYPGIKGAKVQNLSVGAVVHPIDFFFEGENHDLEARAFFQAAAEDGTWKITHPTLGLIENLYLASISEDLNRTDKANISDFRTRWIEDIPDEKIISVPDIVESLRFQVTVINDVSGGEFDRAALQETATARQSIVNTSKALLAKIQSGLAALYELNAEINSRVNAIQRAIQSALNEVILKPLTLAAQFQQLIQLPALATNDIKSRLENYANLAEDIFSLTPTNVFTEDKNIAACMEMNLTAILTAATQSLVTGPLLTRSESIEVAEFLFSLFVSVTNGLDNIEAAFKEEQADRQYFSQTDSYANLLEAVSGAVNTIIKNSFELRIEKRFVLETARSPVYVTIKEYGDLGENDANLELFYNSNKLRENDTILLPAGKELVVYV